MGEVKETARALNTLARHKMIEHIYKDILVDLQICEIEGWDKMEYIEMLQAVVNHFGRKKNGLQEGNGEDHQFTIWEILSIPDIQ